MLQKIPWKVWVPVLAGVLAVTWVGQCWSDQRQELRDLRAAVAAERALRDTAAVKEAAATADRDRYAALYAAAKQVQGKPVAGVTIRIRERDTVVVHDTVHTVLTRDSTRMAQFRDSTFAGVLEGLVEAPPCCLPLRVEYRLTRPAFAPTVGFVQSGERVLAMVQWEGESASAEAPFYVRPKPKRWTRWTDVLGDPDALTVRIGTSVRVFNGIELQSVAERRFSPQTPGTLQVGARYIW